MILKTSRFVDWRSEVDSWIILLKVSLEENLLVTADLHKDHLCLSVNVFQVLAGRMYHVTNNFATNLRGCLLTKDCNQLFYFMTDHHGYKRFIPAVNNTQSIETDFNNFTSIQDPRIVQLFIDQPDIRAAIEMHPRLQQPLSLFPGRYVSLPPINDLPAHYKMITSLSLTYRNMEVFPSQIVYLENLQTLDLSGNRIDYIPGMIFNSSNPLVLKLKYLNISKNLLKKIPKSICNLKNLAFLCVCDNQLSELPTNLDKLQSLVKICLTQNRLHHLPSSILKIRNLRCCVEKNLLDSWPIELGISEKIPTLYDMAFEKVMRTPHLRDQMSKISKFLNHSDFCICGEVIFFQKYTENFSREERESFRPTSVDIVGKYCSEECHREGPYFRRRLNQWTQSHALKYNWFYFQQFYSI